MHRLLCDDHQIRPEQLLSPLPLTIERPTHPHAQTDVPLAEAVASLEKRVVLLEPGRLDSLRQKAQLAKAELDSLAKARASASSSGAAGSSRQKKVTYYGAAPREHNLTA